MTLLNLRPGDKIHISPDICIEFVEKSSTGIRIGITVPNHQRIYRESALRRLVDEQFVEYGHGDA